ncbi:hypothetical protein C8Q78DRAFT_1116958, partial [Trametes maxima]
MRIGTDSLDRGVPLHRQAGQPCDRTQHILHFLWNEREADEVADAPYLPCLGIASCPSPSEDTTKCLQVVPALASPAPRLLLFFASLAPYLHAPPSQSARLSKWSPPPAHCPRRRPRRSSPRSTTSRDACAARHSAPTGPRCLLSPLSPSRHRAAPAPHAHPNAREGECTPHARYGAARPAPPATPRAAPPQVLRARLWARPAPPARPRHAVPAALRRLPAHRDRARAAAQLAHHHRHPRHRRWAVGPDGGRADRAQGVGADDGRHLEGARGGGRAARGGARAGRGEARVRGVVRGGDARRALARGRGRADVPPVGRRARAGRAEHAADGAPDGA